MTTVSSAPIAAGQLAIGTTRRTILLTGGAGFIGSHLAERLAEDHQIVLFDNFRRDSLAQAPDLAKRSSVRVLRGDVLEPSSIAAAMEGVDTVIHLAAMAGVSSYYLEPLRTLEVNLVGTMNVLRECARQKVEKFIYFSTSEVFGPEAVLVSETSPCNLGPSSDRRWTYATSKLAGEQFTLRMAEEAGFHAVIVRPFNVYGPRQTGEGAISNFSAAALAGQPLRVHGDGSEIRAWCFIDDMVDAIAAILDSPLTQNESFNIGNPHAVESTLGLARRVARIVQGTQIEFEEVTRTGVRVRIPDIAKARDLLGLHPRVGLDEGLARTIQTLQRMQSPT